MRKEVIFNIGSSCNRPSFGGGYRLGSTQGDILQVGGWFCKRLIVHLFVVLFLFPVPGALAQQHYVDVDNGSGDACSDTEPCSLDQAITNAGEGETIYVRSRRPGDTVTIDGDYGPLNVAVNFAAYTRGSTEATSATLAFTGKFELGESGKFLPLSKVTAQFENLLISNGNTNPFGEYLANLGSVTVSTLEAGFITINRLQVEQDLVIKRLETATTSPVVTIQELEVSQGATLTIGLEMNEDGSDREYPVHLRVPLRQASNVEEKFDSLVVHGIIDGAGSLLIVHDNSATGRGASGMDLHVTADYTPTGTDHTDCVKIAGNGEIHTDLYAVSAGNICVTLKKIGRLIVTGSIQADEYSNNTEMITTDVIFREDVEIMGNIEQWNDAKILFEKKVTIEGSVILDSGPFSYPVLTSINTGDNAITLGTPRDNFDKISSSGDDLIIRGVRRADRQSCWPEYRQTDTRLRPIEHQWISGIRFEGPSDIAQDLDMRHYSDNRDHEGTSRTDTGAAQRCLIAVDFWIPQLPSGAEENQTVTSRIGGDLLVENGGSINLSGQIRSTFTFTPVFNLTVAYSNHHLELDGDIIADGEFGLSIWEGGSKRSDSFRGECTSTDGTLDALTLKGSSLFILTDEREHEIVLSDGNMRMFSLAIREKVNVNPSLT
ncbi:MAG: hypothetical protein F4Z63_07555 [Gammaproteobacteria bacterium]|nr:hypothetical protein [Gammaproteobacteria bacterium]MYJ20877.1 hypothetical protein [Rhodothermaceae bacterium]